MVSFSNFSFSKGSLKFLYLCTINLSLPIHFNNKYSYVETPYFSICCSEVVFDLPVYQISQAIRIRIYFILTPTQGLNDFCKHNAARTIVISRKWKHLILQIVHTKFTISLFWKELIRSRVWFTRILNQSNTIRIRVYVLDHCTKSAMFLWTYRCQYTSIIKPCIWGHLISQTAVLNIINPKLRLN